MATGNDMMMEAVKLVDGIVGELRGFDETPPPKKVWLDIADRLEKAFGQYRDATMSFMDGIKAKMEDMDSLLDHQTAFKMLGTMEWKETMFLDLQTHDFGGGIFILRCKHGEPNEHYCIIKANDVDEAIRRAVFDLRKPSEQIGNFGRMRNALSTVSAWLNIFEKEVKPRDNTYSASEIKGKVDEALNSRVRNCDRFNDALDAQLEFLNEVWLISVDRGSMLERDKFENWTPEMKARYAEWLMELKDAKEGGDKCEPTEQKA
jgi:hypothetical protein